MNPFSRVATDVDYDRDGKQLSSLRLVQPRNDSAWHTLSIPIAVVKNGSGPTLLLTGGVHGDEFEGPVALLKLLRRLEPDRVRGRVIIVPGLNLPAVQAGQRLSPIDGKDLNRSFPGEPNGSVTSAIAAYVETALLPMADVILDIHSGGRSMTFLPCLWMNGVADQGLRARMFDCARAFAAPITLVTPPLACGAMSDSAERMGKVYLSTEVAGAAMLSPSALRMVEQGLHRLMASVGVTEPDEGSAPRDVPPETRFMHITEDGYLTATEPGLLEPAHEIGDVVETGEPLGHVHCMERPERPSMDIVCRRSGTLVGRRALGYVRPGDGVAVIAQDLELD